ncbi:plasminogen-binding N-terminal domain-containing protein [Hydrogenimonas sp.]
MIRHLLAFFALAALLMAGAEPRTETGTLESVSGETATVGVGPVPKGVSGIVVHYYDQTHAAIVSSAFVTESGEGRTTLKLVPYRGLRNPNLPNVKTPPQKGDLVILGYLYDRVLPIVPNQKSLEHAHASFPKLHIIHPDIVAAELAKEKSPIPAREIFQNACEKFNLGIVMIMFSDGTDFLDCVSWVKVGHADVAAVDPQEFKQPFFNRFEEIPSPFYDWSEHKIENFDRFYKRLESEK